MGLSDEEFGRLTLLQFDLLNKRVKMRQDHDYYCAGIVAATIGNVHLDKDKKPEGYSPLDFVPGYRETAPKLKPLSPAEQVAAFQRLLNPPEREIIRVPKV